MTKQDSTTKDGAAKLLGRILVTILVIVIIVLILGIIPDPKTDPPITYLRHITDLVLKSTVAS